MAHFSNLTIRHDRRVEIQAVQMNPSPRSPSMMPIRLSGLASNASSNEPHVVALVLDARPPPATGMHGHLVRFGVPSAFSTGLPLLSRT